MPTCLAKAVLSAIVAIGLGEIVVPNCIALLRGINMGGNKKVAMSDLRAIAEKLGLAEAQTLLQSGNLVFSSAQKPDSLETLLEAAIAKQLDVSTRVLIRTATEWKKLVAGNPFVKEATRDPGHLALMLLKDRPVTTAIAALQKAIVGREVFKAEGRALYVYFPDGFGTSKFTTALIDRVLSTTVTARNWNTVLKIATAAGC